MATSVWAKAGAGSWALDAEENEAELEKQQTQQAPAADFPSLSAAVSSKTKKKKGQTLSLAEFTTYTEPKGNTFQPSFQSKGFTHVDMSALPTGPRERTSEELENSRHGGFRSYGGSGRDRNVGDDSSNSRWGSNSRGGGDETRRSGGGFGRDSGMEFAPSRADEIDNWAQGKKSGFGGGGFDRRERAGGERGGGFFDSQSKADDSDNWVSKKSFVPAEGRGFGGGGFERERRGGFDRRDRGGERGGSGGGFYDSQSKADDSGNWMSGKSFVPNEGRSFGGGSFERERRGVFEPQNRGGLDLETWGKNRVEVSVVENRSISSSRPRLNLQPRTLPVSDVAQLPPAVVAKPKGSNPFGAARPREVVLAEKGQDWKKIDEQLDSMKIKDTTLIAGDADAAVKKIYDNVTDRSTPEIRVERGWWVDARPQSAEKVESTKNGVSEENEP